MRTTLFILRYRLRAFLRGVHAHGFEIFFLGPIIVGGALWVTDRNLGHLREPLTTLFETQLEAQLEAQLAGQSLIGTQMLNFVTLVGVLLWIALGMPATLRELYGQRRVGGVLDTLPISERVRFHASLAVELTHTLPTFLVLLVALGALGGELVPSATVMGERVWRLLAALPALALARMVAALVMAHWRHPARRAGERIAQIGRWLAGTAGLGLALAAPYPALRLLLLPLLAPATQLEITAFAASGVAGRAFGGWAELWTLALATVGLYGTARFLYLAWHRRDLEVAQRLTEIRKNRRLRNLGHRLAGSATARPLTAQINRDAKLILRRFSPAVLTSTGLALTLQGVVLTILFNAEMPALWRQRLAVTGITLSVLAIVALLPFLLKFQLPRFWIEKSTGVDLEQVWKTKLWTAALLALLPWATGTLLLIAAPDLEPAARLTAFLQLAATSWIIASIIGLAVFEIAAQPILGLVFGSLVSLAIAALFIFYPQASWLWIPLYGYVASQIAGRATRRVRLLEVTA